MDSQDTFRRRAGRDETTVTDDRQTILLVEDEEPIRRLVQRILESEGYAVLAARDAREAMRITRHYEGSIVLLLTDVVLPGLSGPEFARRLLKDRPGTKVLYMSGCLGASLGDVDALNPETEFLPKPFVRADLVRKVRSALGT